MTNTQQNRLLWIDILRGIAIIFMVPANLSTLWDASHPMWFRLVGSFAAPSFILLSTAMVCFNSAKHSLSYYLERGAIILSVGVLIDLLLWKIMPFTSYDILYFIGISLPIAYLCRQVSSKTLILLAIIFFVLAPLAQNTFGYHEQSLEVNLSEFHLPALGRVLQSMFVDGWFPIIPWLGLSFFSIALFRMLFSDKPIPIQRLLMLGGSLCVIGFLCLFLPNNFFANLANHGIIENREGYSEIFYRPGVPFMATAIGVFILLVCFSQFIAKYQFSKAIGFFGKYSLFIYILHQVIGNKIISVYFASKGRENITSGTEFFYAVCFTFICIIICCQLIKFAKKVHRPRSVVMQILIGK